MAASLDNIFGTPTSAGATNAPASSVSLNNIFGGATTKTPSSPSLPPPSQVIASVKAPDTTNLFTKTINSIGSGLSGIFSSLQPKASMTFGVGQGLTPAQKVTASNTVGISNNGAPDYIKGLKDTIDKNETSLKTQKDQLDTYKKTNQIDKYNNGVDSFNSAIQSHGTNIDEYNRAVQEQHVNALKQDSLQKAQESDRLNSRGYLAGQAAMSIPNALFNVWKGIGESQFNPTDEQKTMESQIDTSSSDPVTKYVAKPVFQAVTRFFSPMFRGYADDVSQGIAANEAYKGGVLSSKQIEDTFPDLKKTNFQIAGDVLTAAATIYFPNVFAKGVVGASSLGVKQAVLQGMKQSIPMATTFSAGAVLSSGTKDPVEAAGIFSESMLGLIALGGITHGVIPLSKVALDRATKDIITTHNLPKTVYIEPGKIKDFTTAEEGKMINDLHLTNEQFKYAFKNGLTIEVPLEKIVSSADKPWFKKAKDALGIKPSKPKIISSVGGKTTPTVGVKGLLEAPKAMTTEHAPVDKTIPPVLKQEVADAIDTHGVDATHQLIQEKLGVTPEVAGNIIDIAQKKDPEQILKQSIKTSESIKLGEKIKNNGDQKPTIQLKRDVHVTTLSGEKVTIPEDEVLKAYESGGKFLLKDGREYIVSKSQYENIKNNSLKNEAKSFAPELKGTEETVKGASKWKGDELIDNGNTVANLVKNEDNTWSYQSDLSEGSDAFATRAEAMKEAEMSATGTYSPNETKYSSYQLPGGKDYKEVLIKAPIEGKPIPAAKGWAGGDGKIATFKSSHWDEPNVISHLRLNERTFNGKKVTFMEELQSDWAKHNRKLEKSAKDTGIQNDKINNHPLLKNWQELSIKRALVEAVKDGSEYFSWINGEQTSARYNLATQVKEVSWEQNPAQPQWKRAVLEAKDTGKSTAIDYTKEGKIENVAGAAPHDWIGKKLDEVLGKGLADKIMEKESGTLSGEGLKFGGEWANNLYDKQVKNIVEDLTGGKVEKINIMLKEESPNIHYEGPSYSLDKLKEALKISQGYGNIYESPFTGKKQQYTFTRVDVTGRLKNIIKEMEGGVTFKEAVSNVGSQEIAEWFGGEQIVDPLKDVPSEQQAIKITPEIRAIVKGEAPKIVSKTPEEKALKQLELAHKDSGEAMSQILTEMELSKAGSRLFMGYGKDATVTGTPSTFPKWMPEDLRSTKLFNSTIPKLNGEYPKGVNQRALWNAVYDELDARTGIDTSDIRNNIQQHEDNNKGKNAEVDNSSHAGEKSDADIANIFGEESKSQFKSKTVEDTLNEEEQKYYKDVQSVLSGEIEKTDIANIPSFISYDGKERPLVLNKIIVDKIENDHGKIDAKNLILNANEWDYAIKNVQGDKDKINLIKKIPDTNNYLMIGANRDNGFFVVTHFEIESKTDNRLKNLLEKGDSLDRNGRAAVPSFATSPEGDASQLDLSGVKSDDDSIPHVDEDINKRRNNQGGFINPGAIAEPAIKAMKDLNNIVKQSQIIGEVTDKLSDAIYREEGANKALKQRLIDFIKEHSQDITPEEAEHVYHRLEDPNYPLTEKESGTPLTIAREMDKNLEDLREEYRELGGVITQDIQGDQTPRYAKEKGGVIDKLIDSAKTKKIPSVRQGGILTKSLGQGSKHRVFHVAIDSEGKRHVISIKSKNVTKFENNKMTDLGSSEQIVNPKVKEFFDQNVMPKLEKLAEDLGITHMRVATGKSAGLGGNRAGVSFPGQNLIKTRISPERVLIHEIGHQLDEKYDLQEFFKKDDSRNYGKDTSQDELRKLADLRTEGIKTTDSFKKYTRKGGEKMAVMFEAYLHVPDQFKAVAPNIFEKFEEFLGDHKELNPILDLKPSLVLGMKKHGGNLVSGIKGHTFMDNTGKSYTIDQATTMEIEKHTSTRYHKDFLTNYALAIERTARATRALKFLEKIKNSPEFKDVIAKEGEKEIPTGWKPTKLMQFRGYYFEPRTAEVLDDFAKRQEGGLYIPVYDELNNFLISAIVINPVMHFPNVAMGWASAEAATGIVPALSSKSRANFARAFNAVKNKNEDYLTFLEHGAPLMDLKGINKEFAENLLERMSNEVKQDPTQFQKIAKILGYANPLEWLHGISHFSEKATWTGNDVMMLQALYDHMDAKGSSMEEAIKQVTKRLADYRIPSRIGPTLAGRALSVLMQNNGLFMFSRYHYSGVVKPWIESMKDAARPGSTPTERFSGLRALAFFAFMGLVVYPAINKLLQGITGDPNTYMSQSGAMRLSQNVTKLAKGQSTPGQFAMSIFSPNPAAKIATGLLTGYDPSFGNPVYGPGGEGMVPLITSQISPYQEARKITIGQGSWKDFFLSMGGVYTPKSSSAEKTRNAMVFQEKPQVLKNVKDHILAGDADGATQVAREFNVRLKAVIKQALIENGKSGSDAQVNFVWQKDAVKMPGDAAMANYAATNGKGFIDKTFSDGKPQIKTNVLIQNDSIIHAVQVYAKAITVDPVTAFHDIFAGQTIRMVDNSTIIVQRMSVSESQAKKASIGSSTETTTKGMTLDHRISLELGGTNEESNLQLVPADQAKKDDVIENYLGDALRGGKIDKATAQHLELAYKARIINFDDIKKQVDK